MYRGPIIDTHMHLWDLANDYPWLSPDSPTMRQLFGHHEALKRNCLVPDCIELTRGWNITRSVHVQAMGFPHGIVALADLADPQLERTLRMADSDDHMRDAAWRRGSVLLARHGLVFDMQIYAHQVPDAVMLAHDFANTTIVVEHLAWPIGDLQAGFGARRVQMESLAACTTLSTTPSTP